MRSVVRLVAWCVVAALLCACGADRGEVLVTVRVSYQRVGFSGVDRYRLTIYRRDSNRRWVARTGISGAGVFLLAGSSADPRALGDSGMAAIPGDEGRHLLRPVNAMDAADVLVEVQAGQATPTEGFYPTGPPVAAQFRFPRTGRGHVTLHLDEACRRVSLASTLHERAPYYRCVAPSGCPVIEPICESFGSDSGSTNVHCADEPAPAGAQFATCPLLPGEATAGADAMDLDATGSSDAPLPGAGVANEGETLAACATGSITCGHDGNWSRCVGDGECGPEGGEGQFCCPDSHWQYDDPGSPACQPIVDGTPVPIATVRLASDCHGSLACSPVSGRCERCGLRNQVCCAGDTCLEGACSNRQCSCGHDGESCCVFSAPSCEVGYACTGGTCTRCGASVGQPCCAGGGCPADSICDGTTCQACGAVGLRCCANNGCSDPNSICLGACTHCGQSGEPCCAGGGCAGGLRCDANTCRACGDPGQPCCSGTCFGPGLICNYDNICHACGTAGQPCCNGACAGANVNCYRSCSSSAHPMLTCAAWCRWTACCCTAPNCGP